MGGKDRFREDPVKGVPAHDPTSVVPSEKINGAESDASFILDVLLTALSPAAWVVVQEAVQKTPYNYGGLEAAAEIKEFLEPFVRSPEFQARLKAQQIEQVQAQA